MCVRTSCTTCRVESLIGRLGCENALKPLLGQPKRSRSTHCSADGPEQGFRRISLQVIPEEEHADDKRARDYGQGEDRPGKPDGRSMSRFALDGTLPQLLNVVSYCRLSDASLAAMAFTATSVRRLLLSTR